MSSLNDQQALSIARRLQASQLYRDGIAQQARDGGNNCQLWSTLWNSIFNTSQRFTQSKNPAQEYEIDLHDLWFVVIQAGMHIEYDHPEQDRIVTQVLSAKVMGTLVRRGPSMEIIEEAVVSVGRIWRDLPFMTNDLTHYWVEHHANMTPQERKNLAALMAKLSSTGTGGDSLCACALIVLRDALETQRPLVQDSSAPSLQHQGLSVADLLPALNMWLLNADAQILQLCDRHQRGFPEDIEKLGGLVELSAQATVAPGFNPPRWQFWLLRLQEISELHNAKQGVSELAGRIANSMLVTVERFDTVMKREVSHVQR